MRRHKTHIDDHDCCLSRRDWLRLAGAAAFAAGGALDPANAKADDDAADDDAADDDGRLGPTRYEGLPSDDYLAPLGEVAKVPDAKFFTEGPAVDRAGNVFFTNTAAEKIMVWRPDRKTLEVFREKSNAANGLYFDPQGRLLACEGGAGRVTRADMATGAIEVLCDKYNGFPLAAPNDLCLDGRGRLFFSSRPGVDDPAQGNVNAVYRLDPDGALVQVLRWPDIHMPNGLATSPDDKTLYVIESHPDANRHRDLRAYDILEDGGLANGRVLHTFYPGRSGDGMCVDAEGHLYVAAGLHKTRGASETLATRPGIHVFSPAGKLLAFRPTPVDTITNCAFGGEDLKTLYVTCGPYLLSGRAKIAGKASYRPKA